MKCPRCGLVTFDHLRRCPRCEQLFDLVRPLTGRSGALGPLLTENADAQERLRDRLRDARLSRRKRTKNPLSGNDDLDAPEWFEPDPVSPDHTRRRTDGQDEPGRSVGPADPPDEEEASVNPPDSDPDEQRPGPVALEDDAPASGSPASGGRSSEPRAPEAEASEDRGPEELPFDQESQRIEGFQDWREELRERLKRIRARKEKEREEEGTAAAGQEPGTAPAPEQAVPEAKVTGDGPEDPASDVGDEPATDPAVSDGEELAAAPPEESATAHAEDDAVAETGEPPAPPSAGESLVESGVESERRAAGDDERSLDDLLDEATVDEAGELEVEPLTVVGPDSEADEPAAALEDEGPSAADEDLPVDAEDPLADADLHPAGLRITGAVEDPFAESEAEEHSAEMEEPEEDEHQPAGAPEVAAPAELSEEEAVPQDLSEEEAVPQDLSEEEAVPEDLSEEEAVPQQPSEEEAVPQELSEDEAVPDELPEEEPVWRELPEEEVFPQELSVGRAVEATEQRPPAGEPSRDELREEEVPEAESAFEAVGEEQEVVASEAAPEVAADEPALEEVRVDEEVAATEPAFEEAPEREPGFEEIHADEEVAAGEPGFEEAPEREPAFEEIHADEEVAAGEPGFEEAPEREPAFEEIHADEEVAADEPSFEEIPVDEEAAATEPVFEEAPERPPAFEPETEDEPAPTAPDFEVEQPAAAAETPAGTEDEPELEFGPAEDVAAAGMDFDVEETVTPEAPAGPAWESGAEEEEAPFESEPAAPSISPSAGPLGERAAATACDGLVLVAIAACLVSAAASATGQSLNTILTEAAVPLGLAWSIFAFGYGLFFNATCGQTIGRMVMKLRVVSTDEFSVGARRAAVRMGASLLSLLPLGLGGLLALRDRQRRTLHDRMSHTRVVKA